MPEEVLPASLGLSVQIINTSSFHGCIRNLYINHELQDFTRGHMKPGVVPGCQACHKLYCVHGVCQPDGTQVNFSYLRRRLCSDLYFVSLLSVMEFFHPEAGTMCCSQGPQCHCHPGWAGLHCDQPATAALSGAEGVTMATGVSPCAGSK